MQVKINYLIDDLLKRVEKSTVSAQKLKQLSADELNFKKSANSWSILECIEHLNLYGDFYLSEIEKQILAGKSKRSSGIFKSGLIGNYFANAMLVKPNGKIKKMKSPKDKNPCNSKLTIITVDRFLKQQDYLERLLKEARDIDLTKVKTSISLTKFIKLRLGDTFRFLVYHIERHVLQAERVLS